MYKHILLATEGSNLSEKAVMDDLYFVKMQYARRQYIKGVRGSKESIRKKILVDNPEVLYRFWINDLSADSPVWGVKGHSLRPDFSTALSSNLDLSIKLGYSIGMYFFLSSAQIVKKL